MIIFLRSKHYLQSGMLSHWQTSHAFRNTQRTGRREVWSYELINPIKIFPVFLSLNAPPCSNYSRVEILVKDQG